MFKKIPVSVDFKKYRHIWCIGCSLTENGPQTTTWADHLAQHYPTTNLGKCGAGNQYIFQTLWELEIQKKFSPNDLIMVQWTTIFRESRRIRGKWVGGGNLWTQNEYPIEFIKTYCDPNEFYYRDMALIKATQLGLLDRYNHYEFSASPLTQINQYHNRQLPSKEKYETIQNRLLPSFYEILWNNDIQSRKNNHHPLSEEHLLYLKKVFNWVPEKTNSN